MHNQQQPQADPIQYGGRGAHYAEGGVPKNEMGFNDIVIRANFVRKVFAIVSVMLAVVALMTAVPFFHHPTMQFIRHSEGGRILYIAAFVVFLVVYIVLMCCEGVRRTHPTNIICTGVLTLSIGYLTAMVAARHHPESVLLCLIITTICCAGIIVFSSQTKYDLTSMYGVVTIIGLVIMVFGFVAILSIWVFHVRWFYTIFAGLAALLFMFYLAIDVQMVMGGDRELEISPEEHIFAAVQIFMDIVLIFWYLLALFGGSK